MKYEAFITDDGVKAVKTTDTTERVEYKAELERQLEMVNEQIALLEATREMVESKLKLIDG